MAELIPNKIHLLFKVNWEQALIKDDDQYQCYTDDEIEGQFKKNIFNNIFKQLDEFKSTDYLLDNKRRAITETEEYGVHVHCWSNKNCMLQCWIPNEENGYDDYLIVFNTDKEFITVGIINGHPQVICSKFGFFNSDGSTGREFELDDISLKNVKSYLKKYVIEYIFDQIH